MLKHKKMKDRCRITLSGDMTIYNAAELKSRLDTILVEPNPLYFHLKDVTEIDSAGVQLLLMISKTRTALRLPVYWQELAPAVLEALDNLGLKAYLLESANHQTVGLQS